MLIVDWAMKIAFATEANTARDMANQSVTFFLESTHPENDSVPPGGASLSDSWMETSAMSRSGS